MPLPLYEPGIVSPRSLYCNFYEIPGTYTKEYFLFGSGGIGTMRAMAKRAPWFSTLNGTVKQKDFPEFMQEIYPEKSRFEK